MKTDAAFIEAEAKKLPQKKRGLSPARFRASAKDPDGFAFVTQCNGRPYRE